jgi:hypothetical protein
MKSLVTLSRGLDTGNLDSPTTGKREKWWLQQLKRDGETGKK